MVGIRAGDVGLVAGWAAHFWLRHQLRGPYSVRKGLVLQGIIVADTALLYSLGPLDWGTIALEKRYRLSRWKERRGPLLSGSRLIEKLSRESI
jgi:hypothetical protein